jgi:hypothetical protein
MKNIHTLIIIALLLVLSGCSTKTRSKVQVLFTPEEASLSCLDISKDAKVAIVKDSKGENVLQLSCSGQNKAPYVILHDKSDKWRLSRNNYLAADITNNGKLMHWWKYALMLTAGAHRE